jgi:hypothetical protein
MLIAGSIPHVASSTLWSRVPPRVASPRFLIHFNNYRKDIMNIKRIVLPFVACTILAACGSSKDSYNDSSRPDSAISNVYQGVWTAPGYGMSAVIGQNSIDIYRHTSDYCFHIDKEDGIDTSDINRVFRPADETDTLEWFAGFGTATTFVPGIHFKLFDTLPISCQTNLVSMLEGADEQVELDALDIWDLFSEIFDEYYVDFSLQGVNWNQTIHDAGIGLHEGVDDATLFSAMEQTLVTLKDGHNYIQAPQGWWTKTLNKPTLLMRLTQEFASENGLPFPLTDDVIDDALIEALNDFLVQNLEYQWELVTQYAQQPTDIKMAHGGLIRWFDNEGIGYLYIGGMTGYSDIEDYDDPQYAQETLTAINNALDSALEDLKNSQGLIIDIRNNDGGHDYVSKALAQRFTDTQVHAYSKQTRSGDSRTPLRKVYLEPHNGPKYTGPIALLTSSSTVSAAEVFALSMSQLPNVILIGEDSQGAFSDVLEWTLPNGFHIGFSNEFYLSPEGEWFESRGVPVDFSVPFFSVEQRNTGTDLGIDSAITILTN